MKLAHLLHCLCLSVLVAGCNPQAPSSTQMPPKPASQPIGRTLNPLRRELGLIPIGDNWVLYKSNTNEEHWVVRKGSPSGKTVFKDSSGKVIKEEDHYYSGVRFTDRHEYGSEFISAIYDYQTKQIALGYSGTNKTAEAVVSRFTMTVNGGSTDVAGAIAALKEVAASWPDGPK